MDSKFRFGDKLLYLRLNRLTHTPPALQSAQILVEKGLPLLAFEFGKENSNETLISGNIPIRRCGNALINQLPHKLQSGLLMLWTLRVLIRGFKREGKPRFITAHGLQESWLAYHLHQRFKIPYAVHVHELYEPKDVSGLNAKLLEREKAILGQASFLIFAGEERARAYQEIYQYSCPAISVFNGPRLRTPPVKTDLKSKLNLDPKTFLALYIGGLGPRNALEELILAMELVPKSVVLLLAGFADPDYEERLKKIITERKLDTRVKLLGPVKDKWEWVDNVDLGVCLYQPVELRLRYVAGASNKLFEFISAGVPVVVNSQPDFVKLVSHNELGVCASELTPKSIARAIQRIMEDTGFRQTAARKGRALHRDLLNFDTQFAKVLGRYQELFKGSGEPASTPASPGSVPEANSRA